MLPAAARRQGPGAASCGESNLTVLSLWGLENPHTAPRQETLHPALQRGLGQAGGRRGEARQPKRLRGFALHKRELWCPPAHQRAGTQQGPEDCVFGAVELGVLFLLRLGGTRTCPWTRNMQPWLSTGSWRGQRQLLHRSLSMGSCGL